MRQRKIKSKIIRVDYSDIIGVIEERSLMRKALMVDTLPLCCLPMYEWNSDALCYYEKSRSYTESRESREQFLLPTTNEISTKTETTISNCMPEKSFQKHTEKTIEKEERILFSLLSKASKMRMGNHIISRRNSKKEIIRMIEKAIASIHARDLPVNLIIASPKLKEPFKKHPLYEKLKDGSEYIGSAKLEFSKLTPKNKAYFMPRPDETGVFAITHDFYMMGPYEVVFTEQFGAAIFNPDCISSLTIRS